MTSFRTAESVSPKHPDKICDQISDAIVDAYLAVDKNARLAVETVGGHGKMFITGEISAAAHPDIAPIIKRLAGDIESTIHIVKQSPEIASGVDDGGAGDQGIMVGYACDETAEKLPLEVVLARSLNQQLYSIWPYDGKTQVTLRDGSLHSVVASFQNTSTDDLRAAVIDWAKHLEVANGQAVSSVDNLSMHINPAGDWVRGGFDADAGLTGRKPVVDNYGPRVPIGGGCYSGKDATKVDRSGAYMARKIALDYLRKRSANEVYCYLAYAIGYDQPLEATVIVNGLQEKVTGYDLSPRAIIETLRLRKPQFEPTARYGHFGHAEFTWES